MSIASSAYCLENGKGVQDVLCLALFPLAAVGRSVTGFGYLNPKTYCVLCQSFVVVTAELIAPCGNVKTAKKHSAHLGPPSLGYRCNTGSCTSNALQCDCTPPPGLYHQINRTLVLLRATLHPRPSVRLLFCCCFSLWHAYSHSALRLLISSSWPLVAPSRAIFLQNPVPMSQLKCGHGPGV